MRRLKERQRAGFALAEEDSQVIFGEKKKEFKHLLAYLSRNQGKQNGENAFYALRLYLEDLVEAVFSDLESQLEKVEDVEALFKELEPFLVKETQAKTEAILGKNRRILPAEQAVAQLKDDVLGPIVRFFEANPERKKWFDLKQIEQQFDAYVNLDKLPKEISLYGSEEGISLVEAEVIQ